MILKDKEYQYKYYSNSQTNKKSLAFMQTFIQKAFDYPINFLEIGTWFGDGSTNVWLNNLKPNSNIFLVDSWRPYSSEKDLSELDRKTWVDYSYIDKNTTDAFLGAYSQVRSFETHSDLNINISMIRSNSIQFMESINDNYFDVIFLDGDHKYITIKREIEIAKRIVNKKYGIICGDDLDFLPDQFLVDLSLKYKERDYINIEDILLKNSEDRFSKLCNPPRNTSRYYSCNT
jgi:hypothetical protein